MTMHKLIKLAGVLADSYHDRKQRGPSRLERRIVPELRSRRSVGSRGNPGSPLRSIT